MKMITALLVLKCSPEGSDPIMLAKSTDTSELDPFHESSFRRFVVVSGQAIAKRTPPGQCLSVDRQGYQVHAYNRNGLCALGFMDHRYPVRSAFLLLKLVLEEYEINSAYSQRTGQQGGTPRTAQEEDNFQETQEWRFLDDALSKFQDPAQADILWRFHSQMDETQVFLHSNIDSAVAQGRRMDFLVEESSDLSAASKFHLMTDVLLQAGEKWGRTLCHNVTYY